MYSFGNPKKLASILAVVAMAVVASACGGGGGQQDGGGDGNGQQQEAQNVELRLANIFEASHPYNECGVEPAIDRVSEETGGSLTIQNFPGGQLGGQDEAFELVSSQNLDMAIVGSAVLAQQYEPISVINAAYLFQDADHLLSVVNGEIGEQLWNGLQEESNAQVLQSWYNGTRHLTTSNTEVRSPEDLSGLKIRAVDTPITIANVRALGANPVPVAFEELYLGLQQGTVDGQENPIPTIASQNFQEVQQYLMLTGHVVQSTQVVISNPSWEQLSSEQQQVLQTAMETAGEEVRQCIETQEEELLTEWQETGALTIVEDVNFQAFNQQADEFWPGDFEDEWIDGMYQNIKEAADEGS